jgi:hypothetical protein
LHWRRFSDDLARPLLPRTTPHETPPPSRSLCRPDFHGAGGRETVCAPQKIREAILSVKGYVGAEGTYNFDQNGDGLHGYNIVKNDNGKIVFIKHIDFSE